jgi:ferric-dicitrate binding protein FerR (iron transport regulator)
MLSCDGVLLGAVIEDANRDSQHGIRLGEPELAAMRVTGRFQTVPTVGLAGILAAIFTLPGILPRAASYCVGAEAGGAGWRRSRSGHVGRFQWAS